VTGYAVDLELRTTDAITRTICEKGTQAAVGVLVDALADVPDAHLQRFLLSAVISACTQHAATLRTIDDTGRISSAEVLRLAGHDTYRTHPRMPEPGQTDRRADR
jgi:hypothetical protein